MKRRLQDVVSVRLLFMIGCDFEVMQLFGFTHVSMSAV